jgi:endonuclease-3
VPAQRLTPPRRVARILAARRLFAGARCTLAFSTPLELLVATILSAQCTDERVNKVARRCSRSTRARRPSRRRTPASCSSRSAPPVSSGTRRQASSGPRQIVARHGGRVPRTIEGLTALPGVGRKTAGVVLGNAFGIPAIVVDTHVTRVCRRLGLASAMTPRRSSSN